MISRHEDLEDNSEIYRIIDRMAHKYSQNPNIERVACCSTPLNGAVYARSYKEFTNMLDRCRVAFVLITTTLCPYCRLFKPIFYSVAKHYSNKAVFIEVNADYIPEVADMFNVYSTPTTVVLVDGRVVDGVLGYVPANYFRKYVDDLLSSVKCSASS